MPQYFYDTAAIFFREGAYVVRNIFWLVLVLTFLNSPFLVTYLCFLMSFVKIWIEFSMTSFFYILPFSVSPFLTFPHQHNLILSHILQLIALLWGISAFEKIPQPRYALFYV